jgi:hypothetical protein
VETKKSLLSKVVVPMPKVTPIIVEQEAGTAFEAQIAVAVNRLVGNYGVTKHAACATLQHCHLNRVFELADMSYSPAWSPLRVR